MTTEATKVLDKVTLSNGHDLCFALYGAADALNTFILVHGGAGSHQDFKHLSPLLVRENFNVIAVDLPGSGRTSPDAAGGDKLSEDRLVEVTSEFVRILIARDGRRRFVFVGHSLGGGTLLQVAARGKFDSLLGLALINTSGFRPHNAARPFWFYAVVYNFLVLSSVTRFFTVYIVHWMAIYMMGLSPKLTKTDAVFLFHRGATMDFKGVKTCAQYIHDSRLPVFHATARNDVIVEKAISDEVSAVLKPGVKIEYDRGGHNIQRTKAAELAQAMIEWAAPLAKPKA